MERIRSKLWGSGNNARILEKVFTCGADAVDLDLEDTVPEAHKAAARERVREAISKNREETYPKIIVRLNGPSSGLAEDDLDAVLVPGIWAIHLTKLSGPEDVIRFDGLMTELERKRDIAPGSTRIITSVDSAGLVLRLEELARSSQRMYCFVVGGADFAHDIGTVVSPDMVESLWARSYAVLVSRAVGLAPPIHPSGFNLNNLDAMASLLRMGKALGFQGATAVHPKQLPVIHQIFQPSEQEIYWARRVVDAFRANEAQGVASFQIDGQFVDYALLKHAEDVLAQAGPEEGKTDEQ